MPDHTPDTQNIIPELYLILDLNLPGDPLTQIKAAANCAPIISVLIKNDNNNSLNKDLIAAIQAHNIAVLLADDNKSIELEVEPDVIKLGADGIHLNSDEPERFETAHQQLNDDYIIGISVHTSRHNAMQVAQTGASYIAIENNQAQESTTTDLKNAPKDEHETPPTIEWWIALFEIPCVAWNINSNEAALDAQNKGADFLALAPSFWQKESETETALKTLQASLQANADKTAQS